MCQILLRSAADWLRSVGGDTVLEQSRGGTGSELQEPMLRRFFCLSLRSLGTAASLLIALALLIATVNAHHPLQHWLVYRYATYCALAAFFLVSWALGGRFVLVRALRSHRTLCAFGIRTPYLDGCLHSSVGSATRGTF